MLLNINPVVPIRRGGSETISINVVLSFLTETNNLLKFPGSKIRRGGKGWTSAQADGRGRSKHKHIFLYNLYKQYPHSFRSEMFIESSSRNPHSFRSGMFSLKSSSQLHLLFFTAIITSPIFVFKSSSLHSSLYFSKYLVASS